MYPQTSPEVVGRFMETILENISEGDRAQLSSGSSGYLESLVGYAIKAIEKTPDAPERVALKNFILDLYSSNPKERFIYDPINEGSLVLDEGGEIVTLQGAELVILGPGREGAGEQAIINYDYMVPLTGSQRGEKLTIGDRPILGPQANPVYRSLNQV